MPRTILVCCLGLCFFSGASRADMIEIKDKGVINGKVLSQDKKEVHFEDTRGNQFVVPKENVLYLDTMKDALPSDVSGGKGSKGKSFDLAETWDRCKDSTVYYFQKTKNFIQNKARPLTDWLSKPLDRSAADGKSKKLADSVQEATGSVRSMAKHDRKVSSQKKALKNSDGSTEAHRSRPKSGDSGHFSSLD